MTNDSRVIVTPDESHYMFCDICEGDFDTSKPNPYRIERMAREINAYLIYKKRIKEKTD